MKAPALVRRLGNVYWGWWMVAANSIIAVASGFHIWGTSVYFLPLAETLGLSRGRLSVIFAASRLEGGLEAPLAGWLIDKVGPRQLLLVGGVLVGAGYILLATVVNDFWSLFFIYTILISAGFGFGFFSPIFAALNIWFVRRRTTAIGIMGTFIRGSQFIMTPLLAFMIIHLGWHQTALLGGIIMLSITSVFAWANRPSPEAMGLLPDGDKAEATPPNPGVRIAHEARVRRQPPYDFTVRDALKTSTFWLLTLAQGTRFLVNGALMIHIIPILVWKGLSRQGAANLVGLQALVGIPAVLFFGWAGDRFNMKVVGALAALVGTMGVAILPFATKTWHLYPFIVLNGVADSSFPVIISMMGEYFGRKSYATLRGISQFFTAGASFAATLLTGWVFDVTGGYNWALIPMIFVAGVAVPFFLAIRYPKPPRVATVAAGPAPRA